MRNQNTVYQLGRMNIIVNYDCDKTEVINSFFKEVTYKKNKDDHIWSFTDIKRNAIKNDVYFTGNLVKSVDKAEEEIIDKATISSITVKNKLKGKSNFCLECSTGLIAFAPDMGKISAKQFKEFFAKICQLSSDYPFIPVEISTIDEQRSVLDRIKELETINKVKIQLRPSNPSPSKAWKKIDDKLHSLNINSYSASYVSESGIDFASANDIRSELAMASDGYGNATIHGSLNGSQRVISTQTKPITETVCLANQTTDKGLLNRFIDLFKDIQTRVHNNENI